MVHGKTFHLKAAAIIALKFAEVLYLNSNNIPVRDPAYLFDEPVYKNSGGAVFGQTITKITVGIYLPVGTKTHSNTHFEH